MNGSRGLKLQNIKKVYTPSGEGYLMGENQGNIQILDSQDIHIVDGRFHNEGNTEEVIDCSDLIAIPGFVDSHTHMVYAGGREEEFIMRARGVSYLELLESGNGIMRTVRTTVDSSEERILRETLERLMIHIMHGVTTVEMKTGYGMNLENEEKMLRVMHSLEKSSGVRIVKTLLPMHARPPENYAGDYVSESIRIMKKLRPMADFTDVFCDRGAFSLEETERYLEACSQEKIPIRIHADELDNIGATSLAEKFRIYSMDHLLKTGKDDLKHFRKGGSAATILPITAFSLGEKYPDAREFIDNGIPLCVASDVSPLSPVPNMQFAGNLAIRMAGMTPEEVLNAMTINPAISLNIGNETGTIKEGKWADMVLFRATSLEDIFYRWDSLLPEMVISRGRIRNVKESFRSMYMNGCDD
ncbi:imidazolonepropionase [Cuniculiplasma sp. SKW4]|uniref:imidazolonepropionase n=1 Tax=Cuniculiplasma sp. SKW4 TaxID=3400171 RepID=UPI003FD2A832